MTHDMYVAKARDGRALALKGLDLLNSTRRPRKQNFPFLPRVDRSSNALEQLRSKNASPLTCV
jgi:hypothetical protein